VAAESRKKIEVNSAIRHRVNVSARGASTQRGLYVFVYVTYSSSAFNRMGQFPGSQVYTENSLFLLP